MLPKGLELRSRVNAVRPTASRSSACTLHRWELAAKALDKYPQVLTDCALFTHQTEIGPCIHYKSQQLATVQSRNWLGDDLLRDVGGLMADMIPWFANFLYGGMLPAARNEPFSIHHREVVLTSISVLHWVLRWLCVVVNFVASSTPWLNEFWGKWMDGEKKYGQNVILGILVCLRAKHGGW